MRIFLIALVASALAGCSGGGEPPAAEFRTPPEEPAGTPPVASGPVVVAFGDSLTAGYGLSPGESYPAQLERELLRRGIECRVVNEGVSGDTTGQALARIGMALAREPEVAIVALGANDGVRGMPAETVEQNLREIVQRFQDAGAEVVVAGMKLPPNFGREYVTAFESIYPKVAKESGARLIPFLLDGVATEPELNLPDEIHPNAEGARRIALLVADALEPWLAGAGS